MIDENTYYEKSKIYIFILNAYEKEKNNYKRKCHTNE